MNRLVYRSSDAATPWMIMLSACVHGFLVLTILIVSTTIPKPAKVPDEPIMQARLVEAPPGPPVLEKVPQSPPGEGDILPQEVATQTEAPVETPHNAARAVVQEETVAAPSESIRITKRIKPPRRVENPKTPEKKTKDVVRKKEDPSAILEKRIAALAKEVANRRSDATESRPTRDKPEAAEAAGGGGFTRGSDAVDKELFKWFASVRGLINARWSVFNDNRDVERATLVGVRIAEDGRLLGASVDESSGDEAFDTSAMRAVYQAAPFPKIPPDAAEKIRRAGGLAFRFTVKGMQ
jgi:TonB family protein